MRHIFENCPLAEIQIRLGAMQFYSLNLVTTDDLGSGGRRGSEKVILDEMNGIKRQRKDKASSRVRERSNLLRACDRGILGDRKVKNKNVAILHMLHGRQFT